MKSPSLLLASIILAGLLLPKSLSAADKPNVVFFFIDDMGYGDIGPFGSTVNKTPHLDRMADEGNILTQFYVSNTACTPSRSALMTGTYAHRIGMDGTVVFPGETRGLNPSEITVAELFKTKGYATGCFGKWHLGDQPEFLPLAQGFDEYFGIPYSNDMWPGNTRGHRYTKAPYTPLPVVRQNEAIAYVADGADQSLLCESVTNEAVQFIKNHRDEPFFLYIPHAYIHGPRFARPEILDKAEGDVNRSNIEEVDTSVGRVLDTLRDLGLDDDTLVIFTSDNGGSGGTSMGPLRGAKGGPKYEGHMREPTITWWPGTIPAGSVTDGIAATIDILPSMARLIGAEVPQDRIIDGHDALPLILGRPGAKSPHEILYYEIEGIRRGDWKLLRIGKRLELYNLASDIGETTNLAAEHPDMVAELDALLTTHAEEIAANQRLPGMVESAEPIISEPGDLPKLRELMGLPDFEVINRTWPPAKAPAQTTPANVTAVDTAAIVGPKGIVLADFEGDSYGDWKVEGEAFGDRPALAGVSPRNKVVGHDGHGLVNSYIGADKSTGTLTSPPFTIELKKINFLLGGGHHPKKACINLLVDDKVVRTATGPSLKDAERREVLYWHSWDVVDLEGKQAIIQIVDNVTTGWGHINVDHIAQSNRAVPEQASAPVMTNAARPFDMTLEELNQLSANYAATPEAYKETYRPQFHFTPLTGWMNDPNGLVYYDGEYHLYFQAWPQGNQARGKIWSHAVSTDLVHWRQIEHALVNDGTRQIYSGSAVIDHNNTAGFQRGDEKTLIAAYTLTKPSVQCIAWSADRGRTFTTLDQPVVDELNPKNRDPKVFWHDPSDRWVMILYLSAPEKFVLLASENLKDWTHLSDLHFPGGHECPELFELPLDGDPANTRWIAWEAAGNYLVGSFDGTTFTPEHEGTHMSEWGPCCYAGQTWNDTPDGRRIFIGWMHAKVGRHVEEEIYADMPFTQQMSVPRTLSLRTTTEGPRLFASPVEELETLRGEGRTWTNLDINSDTNPLADIEGELFDIEAVIELRNARTITLDIRGTPLLYTPRTGELTCLGHTVTVPTVDGQLDLRVLIDRTSIEIFASQGRYVMSLCIKPDAANRNLSLTAQGETATAHSLNIWPMRSIWK